MAKVGRMSVVVTAGTSGLTRGLRASETAIDRFVGRATKASSVIGGQMRKGINSGGTALAAFGASAAAGAVATGLAIKAGADRIDDLADSSKRLLGNSGATGALAALRFAAEEAGVESGMLDKGLEKLLDTISKANRGDKGAIEAFRQIGVDAAELTRMRPEERMIAVADALGKVKDAGDKISLARGIFGKAGGGLVPLFNDGAEAIRDAAHTMDFFGQSVSALDAEKVGTMNDNIGRLQLAWEGVTMQLAVQFAPLVSDISDRLLGMIENAGGVGSAVDKAFGAGVEYTGEMLDAVESLGIGWLKFKRTVTGVGLILSDVSKIVTKPIEKFNEWISGDETDKRLAAIAPAKQEEYKRLLAESGGYQNENIDLSAGLRAENDDIQRQIKEAEENRRVKGSLGDRFVAWEKSTQAKGATNAAAKLADAAASRLDTEEAITKEAEKQTKEKEDQLRLESGGQGKFALMAFNGVTGSGLKKKTAETKSTSVVGTGKNEALAKAASSEEEIAPAMGDAVAAPAASPDKSYPALSSQRLSDITPQQKAPAFGSKEFFDGVIFGGTGKGYDSKRPSGEPDWKSKQLRDDRPRDYNSHRPAPEMLAREAGYSSKTPTGEPAYVGKMGPSMQAAVEANPMAKASQSDAKLDKIATLLEQIAGNTKEPRVARMV